MRHFSWLDEKKKEAAALRQMGGGNSGYATPVRMRYMGNTGTGEDNVIQPSNPTTMVDTTNGPRMLHEDENLYMGNNNQVLVQPSRFTQSDLRNMERTQNIPGYQEGGYIRVRGRGRTTEDVGGVPEAGTAEAISDAETLTVPTLPKVEQTTPELIKAPKLETTTYEPQTIQLPKIKETPQPEIVKFDTSAINPQETQTVALPKVKATTQGEVIKAPTEIVPTETISSKSLTEIPTFDQTSTQAAETTIPEIPTTQAPTTTTTAAPVTPQEQAAPTLTQEDLARRTALGRLSQTAQGITPEYDAALQQQIDQARATQDVEQYALAQQAAQEGVSPQVLAARQAMGRATGRQTIADLAAQGVLGKGELQQQAVSTLASQSLAGQQFEQEKQKYGDTAAWTAYEAALTAGDYNEAAQQYANITGNSISMEEMKNYQNYLNTSRAQQLTSTDIQLEASRLGVNSERLSSFIDAVNSGADLTAANAVSGLNLTSDQFDQIRRDYAYAGETQDITLYSLKSQLGDEKFNSIVDRINSGVSLNRINTEFGTDLTMSDFNNIKGTTTTGQREWERSMSAVNMLLTSEDPANIAEASTMISELFPGVTFDVDQLISDVGSERFAQNMQDMATLASTFDSWTEAKASAEGLNLINNMSLTEAQAKEMFESLQLNEIDEEWNAITGSDFFQNLKKTNPDSAQLIEDTFTAGLSGELEFDITPTYKVVDKNGALVKQFSNIVDANTYLGENADSGYKIEEGKNYVYKNITTGDTVIVNNNGEVQEETTETKPATNDAWVAFQESQADLPESKQITYNNWKIAWDNAGNPSGYTYDKYISDQTEAVGTTSETLADKYKDGWPVLTLQPYKENVAEREDKIMKESEKEFVMDARKNFMANPENLITLNTDTTNKAFNDVNNELLELAKDNEIGLYVLSPNKEMSVNITDAPGSTIAGDYLRNKFFYIDGYDAPFAIKAVNGMTDNYLGKPTQITSLRLVNLKDGTTLTWGMNGEVKNAAYQ